LTFRGTSRQCLQYSLQLEMLGNCSSYYFFDQMFILLLEED
jgi:hypothetical protein